MSTKAAKRYANAFLVNAIEKDMLEKARKDILFIKNTIEASPDLKLFLKNPVIKKEHKEAALEKIFKTKVEKITFTFLELLYQKDREALMEDITKKFIELYNLHQGIIEVGVTSARKLDEEQLKDLQKNIERTTGKKVELKTSIEDELIGGLKIRIVDTVVDGSVKFKLNQLKQRFTSAAVE